jgi:hypothetical protein
LSTKIIYKLKDVFIAGGSPKVTYVERKKLGLETKIQRALEKPNHFASITGVSKSGKTVLLKHFLDERNYIGVDGGQVKDVKSLWATVADRLSQPNTVISTQEIASGTKKSAKLGFSAKIPHFFEANAQAGVSDSAGSKSSTSMENTVDLQNACGRYLVSNEVILVIDDFHYIKRDEQTEIVRNLKNFVYEGLKVVLLSVPYKAYEAIQAEVEITGRFVHVNVPVRGRLTRNRGSRLQSP